MKSINGYTIVEKLHEGAQTVVYRAIEQDSSRRVILKILNLEYPLKKDIQRMQREYALIRSLDIPGVIRAYDIKPVHNSYMLVLEDFGGQSLRTFIQNKPTDIKKFLKISVELLKAVGEIHEHGIIHKDLKPENILINPKNGKIQIIDFSISSAFSKEIPRPVTMGTIVGAMAYISPEQTGWTGRVLDYRTDFYTLGLTFYEMIAGAHPFPYADSLELVHAHLAKTPPAPETIRPGIPAMVSRVVLKMLAKSSEERYKSVVGIIRDLEFCQKEHQKEHEKKSGIPLFKPGRWDHIRIFQYPEKIYGREHELNLLQNAYQITNPKNNTYLVLHGKPGSGKTALVNQFKQNLFAQNNFFLSGKFEPYQRDIPYSALGQAFGHFINEVLLQDAKRVAFWKNKILSGMSESVRLLNGIIPNLDKLIGEEPPENKERKESKENEKIPTEDMKNRIPKVFQDFINIFSLDERHDRGKPQTKPFVLFLDDIQWADLPSVRLLSDMFLNRQARNILLLLSYRETEIARNQPANHLVKKMAKKMAKQNGSAAGGSDISVLSLQLASIEAGDIALLIKDMLLCTEKNAKALALEVKRHTNGNPFFISQFLQTLYQKKLIRLNRAGTQWKWDINEIKKTELTDNVIHLLSEQLHHLPEEEINVLKLASSIGSTFPLKTVAFLFQKSEQDTLEILKQVVEKGFVVLSSAAPGQEDNITFSYRHDEILHAAYSLLSRKERTMAHRETANLMLTEAIRAMKSDHVRGWENVPNELKKAAKKENSFHQLNVFCDAIQNADILFDLEPYFRENIFSLVFHVANAVSKKDDYAMVLVFLNLMAAMKAKSGSAYELELYYLQSAGKHLTRKAWKSHYSIALSLHTWLAQSYYVNTEFGKAVQCCQTIQKEGQNPVDQLKSFNVILNSLTAENKTARAIELGLEALKSLGIAAPAKPGPLAVLPDIIKANVKMAGKYERVENLAPMENREMRAAMNLFTQLITPSFISSPNLAPVLVLKMVLLTLQYGIAPESAYAFVFFGLITGSALGNYRKGKQLGDLGLKLMERSESGYLNSKCLFIYGNMIQHWNEPGHAAQANLLQAYHEGLQNGDLLFASYSLNWYNAQNYLTRRNLDITLEEMEEHNATVLKVHQEDPAEFYCLWREFVSTLAAPGTLRTEIDGKYFHKKKIFPVWEKNNINTCLYTYYLMRGILYYFKKQYEKALKMIEKAIGFESGVFGMPVTSEHNFFYSLILSSYLQETAHDEAKKQTQKKTSARNVPSGKYIRQIKKNQKKLKTWAALCPHNYLAKYEIIEGELQSLNSNPAALEYYEKAMRHTIENEYLLERAIANQRISHYHLKQNKKFLANVYFAESYYLFFIWGAKAIQTEMEVDYIINPYMVRPEIGSTFDTPSPSTPSFSSHNIFNNIDLQAVLKASQSISRELDLNSLALKLLKNSIESSGAQSGYLLLNRENQLLVVAEGKTNETVKIIPYLPIERFSILTPSLIQYAKTMGETFVIHDTKEEKRFIKELKGKKAKTILCHPVMYKKELLGMLYLENSLMSNVFTPERIGILDLLTTQAIISLNNAFYIESIKKTQEALEKEVQQHMLTEGRLRQSEERYALAAEGSNAGLWDWDLIHDKIYYSTRWRNIIGYKKAELNQAPSTWMKLIHSDDLPFFQKALQAHLDGNQPRFEAEYRMKHKDGSYRWVITTGMAIRDENRKPYRIAGSQTDITQRKTAEEQLRHDAFYDSLTDLPNWNLLLNRLNHAMTKYRRQKNSSYAILFLDIDRFKNINENFGHEFGNALLRRFASLLQESLRPEDTVARLGGDEFAILLEEIIDINEVIRIVGRIQEILWHPIHIENQEIYVSYSIGIVLANREYKRPEEMIRDADTALHRAKSQGKQAKDNYAIFDQTMQANVASYFDIERNIRKAIDQRQFSLHYQPIVCVKNGKILGSEALLRWKKNNVVVHRPDEFIPIAEDTGLIIPLGEWVLKEAIRQTRKWQSMGYPDLIVSVNLSAKQLNQANLVEKILSILHANKFDERKLHLELTESIFIENAERTDKILKQLKKNGIKISLDDFGTGYSSLKYIKNFPIDKLKIDQSFVTNITERQSDAALIKAIIAMSEALNIKVLAEGVENISQFESLSRLRCDEVQGYYFSKPLSADDFTRQFIQTKKFRGFDV